MQKLACRTGGLAGPKRDTRAREAKFDSRFALVFALRARVSRFALCLANPPILQATKKYHIKTVKNKLTLKQSLKQFHFF